ncbi:MAG TPA: hypothetical protein ENN79_10970 [Desulfobacteraceae bacterium]|nr:hypothetical protein [Desulfobacteraceae bacterium]
MNTQVAEYLSQAELGGAQKFKNLVMVPIVSRYRDRDNYLLLDEALQQDTLKVMEVDRQGSVPDLKVVNKSGRMVLIFDGEELVGAKQNRIVNTTILLAPESETTIPVSCVEQGRWAHTSDHFFSEKRMSPSFMRKNKAEHVMASLRMDAGFKSDQGRIWSEIHERQARRAAHSPTGRMSELYTKDRPLLDEYLHQFRSVDNQVGALFLVNGRIAGLDGFGSPGILARVFPKLVESYAIDALDMYRPGDPEQPNGADSELFLRGCLDAKSEERPSVALGIDCRLSSQDRIGAAIVFQDRVLHLSFFAREAGEERYANIGSRFARMSHRRRFRSE